MSFISDGKIGVEIMRDKLIEAVKLISDYCRHTKCNKCMFDYYGDWYVKKAEELKSEAGYF